MRTTMLLLRVTMLSLSAGAGNRMLTTEFKVNGLPRLELALPPKFCHKCSIVQSQFNSTFPDARFLELLLFWLRESH